MNSTEWYKNLESQKHQSSLHWVTLQQLDTLSVLDSQCTLLTELFDTDPELLKAAKIDPPSRKEMREIIKMKSDILNKVWDELETLYPVEEQQQSLEVVIREVTGNEEV